MARTSFTRQREASKGLNAFSGTAALMALLLLGATSLGLAGCGNDNPADSGGTVQVDIRGLIDQMNGGGGFSTSATGVSESPATTPVKSLIIGAVVITFTDTPLTSDSNIDNDLSDKLADDVINSINYFSIVDLPTSESFVEFKVPPPGAGHWQVAAIGTKNRIETFDDLSDENVAVYYGFTPKFYNTSGDSGPTVDIEMKRACFIDEPPKGCAAYGDDATPVVTTSVRILTVYRNSTNLNTVVQNVTDSTSADNAVTMLNAAKAGAVVGDTLTVVTTHPLAPDYNTGACSSVTPETNVAAIDDPCVGTFATKL